MRPWTTYILFCIGTPALFIWRGLRPMPLTLLPGLAAAAWAWSCCWSWRACMEAVIDVIGVSYGAFSLPKLPGLRGLTLWLLNMLWGPCWEAGCGCWTFFWEPFPEVATGMGLLNEGIGRPTSSTRRRYAWAVVTLRSTRTRFVASRYSGFLVGSR